MLLLLGICLVRKECGSKSKIGSSTTVQVCLISHKFHNLAHKVSHSPECCVLLENALDCLCTQLEEKLKLLGANEPSEDKENIDPNVQQRDDLLSAAQLKKKDVQSNKSRRTQT